MSKITRREENLIYTSTVNEVAYFVAVVVVVVVVTHQLFSITNLTYPLLFLFGFLSFNLLESQQQPSLPKYWNIAGYNAFWFLTFVDMKNIEEKQNCFFCSSLSSTHIKCTTTTRTKTAAAAAAKIITKQWKLAEKKKKQPTNSDNNNSLIEFFK